MARVHQPVTGGFQTDRQQIAGGIALAEVGAAPSGNGEQGNRSALTGAESNTAKL